MHTYMNVHIYNTIRYIAHEWITADLRCVSGQDLPYVHTHTNTHTPGNRNPEINASSFSSASIIFLSIEYYIP